MGWVRVDDSFYDHPKFAKAGPLGIAQWLAALAWSNRNLQNGKVPKSVSRRLLDWEGVAWKMWGNDLFGAGEDAEADEVSELLVDCGLWEAADGGYLIHDYDKYQPSAEQIQAARLEVSKKKSDAGRKGAAKRWQNGKPDGTAIAEGMAKPKQNDSPNPNPNSVSKETERRKKTSALPPDFEITDGMFKWAQKKGLSDPVIVREGEKFINHHRAKGSKMLDWNAAWRTWILRCLEYNPAPEAESEPPKPIECSNPECEGGVVETDAGYVSCVACKPKQLESA